MFGITKNKPVQNENHVMQVLKKTLSLLLMMSLFGCQRNQPNWDDINTRIVEQYNDVEHISIEQFNNEMRDQALLIDVREPAEFAISHIPGAENITNPEVIASMLLESGRDIVVYCSVGYRSAAMARTLQSLGLNNVSNLQGSIFAWANEGLPLVNQSGSTANVHPYDDEWGRLLEKSVPTRYE